MQIEPIDGGLPTIYGGLATIRAQLAICKNKSTGQKRVEKGGLRGRKKKNQFSVDRADDT